MSSRIRHRDEPVESAAMVWEGWSTEAVDKQAPNATPEAAQVQADFVIQLKRQLEAESEAAFNKGFREGESMGRSSCREELEAARRQFSAGVRSTVAEKARLREEAEQDVVRLALAIARKILHREVRIDASVALGLVKAATQAIGAREIQVVRTTPFLAKALAGGFGEQGIPENVRIVEDGSLEAGGLIVETSRGEVDASLETQFEEISRGLLQAVEGSGGRR